MPVFISYRREDSAAIAGRIDDYLRSALGEDEVYRDIDNIPPGANFFDHINSALERCDVCIALLGPRWTSPRLLDDTDFVRRELQHFLKRGAPIVPVLVEEARIPSPEEIPEALHGLLRLQALEIDSGGEFRDQAKRLVKAIKRLQPRSRWLSPKILAPAACAALAVVVIAAKLGLSSSTTPNVAPSTGLGSTASAEPPRADAGSLPPNENQREGKPAAEGVAQETPNRQLTAEELPMRMSAKFVGNIGGAPTWGVQIFLAGTEEQLQQVAQVDYHVPNGKPPEKSSTNRAARFALSYNATVCKNQLGVKVTYKDNSKGERVFNMCAQDSWKNRRRGP